MPYGFGEGTDGVNLKATFRTNVEKYADVFTEEALQHLEEAVYYAKDDIFYVEMPVKNEHNGKTYYVKNYSEYILVGGFFNWSFGGVEGGDVKVKAKTPFQRSTPYQPQEENSTTVKAKERAKGRAKERANELGQMAYELGEEVRQLKEEVATLQAKIAEKEAQIRLYEYAQEELEAVAEE